MKRQLRALLKIGLSLYLFSSTTMGAVPLTLNSYRDQVHDKSSSWKSAQSESQGGRDLEMESDSLTSIMFTSQLSFLDDERPTVNPSFQGSRTQNNSSLFGFKQQTEYGFSWAITQNFSHTHLSGDSLMITMPEYNDAFPKLELTMPLWRNIFGAEIGAQKLQIQQQARTRKLQGELNVLRHDIETESTYYNLLAQKQILAAQKDSIARAERILEWTQNRIQKNLSDASDIFQSQAAVSSRKIDFENTLKNLAESSSRFNNRRGISGSQEIEELQEEDINLTLLDIPSTPIRTKKEFNLQRASTESNEANFRAQKEKYKPSLDLSFVASTQGRDADTMGQAQERMFKDKKDYYLIALNFSMPLNQPKFSELREGYEQMAESQKYSTKSLNSTIEVTWTATAAQGTQLKKQLVLTRELEAIQKKKADAERDKFNRGRSTLFQVLMYEQDYFTARIQRINLELSVRQFISQLALFE